MANLVQELNSLDFSVYIGGPLQAAINAQTAASLAQVDFIQKVGFTQPTPGSTSSFTPELVYVDFQIKKETGDSTTQTPTQTSTIKVPILTMVNVPSIRIEEITIDFNAKLTSVETKNTTATTGVDTSASAGCKLASFKVSASYKKTTTTGNNVEKTYNMAVHVRAVNDELPAGLDRILTMLENEMTVSTVTNNN